MHIIFSIVYDHLFRETLVKYPTPHLYGMAPKF